MADTNAQNRICTFANLENRSHCYANLCNSTASLHKLCISFGSSAVYIIKVVHKIMSTPSTCTSYYQHINELHIIGRININFSSDGWRSLNPRNIHHYFTISARIILKFSSTCKFQNGPPRLIRWRSGMGGGEGGVYGGTSEVQEVG